VGSERYPSFDVTSAQESYYRLRQLHPAVISIGQGSYYTNQFVSGISFDKAQGASWSGVNTRSGSQLTIHVNNAKGAPVTMHAILVFEAVCNISSAGVELLD
jgi:hypothetical protein